MFLNYNNFHNICSINPEIRNHMTGNLRRSRKQQLMGGNNAVAMDKE